MTFAYTSLAAAVPAPTTVILSGNTLFGSAIRLLLKVVGESVGSGQNNCSVSEGEESPLALLVVEIQMVPRCS
jgi:hypothetical protein